MAVFITEIPDFKFSGLYFPQVWQSLIVYKRNRVTELTDENENEPAIQILKAFAAGFHYCNTLLDFVALETLLPTSRLRESIRAHLLLIGYVLKEALAATTEMISKLSSPLTDGGTVLDGSLFAVPATNVAPEILFEKIGSLAIERTDELKKVFEYKSGTDTYTDATDEANGVTLPWTILAPGPDVSDALYIAADVLLTSFTVHLSDPGGGDTVFEYYDGTTDDTVPTAVEDGGTHIEIVLTTLLGTSNRAGAVIVVRDLITGAEAEATSYWDDVGLRNMVDVPYFTVPYSLEAADYLVGTLWKEPPDVIVSFTEDPGGGGPGTVDISWGLPENQERQWQLTEVNGVEAYWIRIRWITSGTSPVYDAAIDTTENQYAKWSVVQGQTQEDDPIGIFDGALSPTYITTLSGLIWESLRAFVDEGLGETEYEVVGDFLASEPTSKHVTLVYDADARGLVTWGDGSSGYLPPVGSEAILRYRNGAEEDGNVGAGEITLIKNGPPWLTGVTNPRAAIGWAPPEASTDESIAEVKVTGPASLRLRDRAVTTTDMEELAQVYVFESGSRLVARARAVVDGFGPKTIRLVVVGHNGVHLTQVQLDELSLAFNGDPVAGIPGKLVAGLELTAVNYTKKVIDITMQVQGGDEDTIEAALAEFVLPTAQKPNGEWRYDFTDAGSTDAVYPNQLVHAAMDADGDVDTVDSVTDPAALVLLGTDELPFPGTIAVTVV